MTYDRTITYSEAGSRKATVWKPNSGYISEFKERKKTPVRSTETQQAYMAMPKKQQDELKDVGGFVGGTLKDNRRKATNVLGRDMITLDLDRIPSSGTKDVLRRIHALGVNYEVYSTRKHSPDNPRLRAIFYTDRTMTAEEYEPIARKLAEMIGLDLCDPTTFESSRLMYWPSVCADSEYIYETGDLPFLCADGMLALYTDWRDHRSWPQIPGESSKPAHNAAKQQDPTTKKGIVGAFCRIYDIHSAIETFMPGVYTLCDTADNRYTYTGGSTTGGAVIYDDAKFLYSHHATDPAGGGHVCNSYDLVRLHKFGHMDDDAKDGTLPQQLPSAKAMNELALQDPAVSRLLLEEDLGYAGPQQQTPAPVLGAAPEPAAGDDWMSQLKINPSTGKPDKTTYNAQLIIANDPALKGRIRINRFSNKIIGYGPLPWPRRAKQEPFEWGPEDDSGVRIYVERILGLRAVEVIQDALVTVAASNDFDPLKDHITALDWDGVHRLDTLLVDYLGAEDCAYTRTVTRKAFVAAVARVMEPGIKFDCMTVIDGPQGIGKSTLLAKMGGQYFSDSVNTLEGKEAAELLQGNWIIEIGELGAFSKSDARLIKMFITRENDQYRAPYARKTEKHPRRCVFFGTTNDKEYLKDTTGNRRFWPVSAHVQQPTKSVFKDLDRERDQIYAEAYCRYICAEPLFLGPEMEAEADLRRLKHFDRDPLQGQIEEFMEKKVPHDWQKWDKPQRLTFWGGGIRDPNIQLVPRDRVCVLEVWYECLGEYRLPSKMDSHRISAVLENLQGWERAGLMRCGRPYGHQKSFRPILAERSDVPDNVIDMTQKRQQNTPDQGAPDTKINPEKR